LAEIAKILAEQREYKKAIVLLRDAFLYVPFDEYVKIVRSIGFCPLDLLIDVVSGSPLDSVDVLWLFWVLLDRFSFVADYLDFVFDC